MSWTTERARVASLSRSREPDDPDLVDARRRLRVERLADNIEKTVAAWPPFTDDDIAWLSRKLRGGTA